MHQSKPSDACARAPPATEQRRRLTDRCAIPTIHHSVDTTRNRCAVTGEHRSSQCHSGSREAMARLCEIRVCDSRDFDCSTGMRCTTSRAIEGTPTLGSTCGRVDAAHRWGYCSGAQLRRSSDGPNPGKCSFEPAPLLQGRLPGGEHDQSICSAYWTSWVSATVGHYSS